MNVLVIYKNIEFPTRNTLVEHLFSIYRYRGRANVFHLWLDKSMYFRKKFDIPRYLKKIEFDVIVFHYSFASGRRGPNWQNDINEVEYFRTSKALKVLFTQDEMYYTVQMCDFINNYGINLVYTLAPASEYTKVFDKVDHTKVKFFTALTGYVDLKKCKENEKKFGHLQRTIDVGYRANKLPPWLGRHAYRKTEIAEIFKKALSTSKLVADISTEQKDTFYGDKWDEFLYKCKYMIGVESGASLLDPDGSIRRGAEEYIKSHPNYTFEEIEALFFPGKDGEVKLNVISPRSFECSASKTCQVLVEGEYNGVMKPGIHYITIKKDFSNLDEVIKKLEDEPLRKKIVEASYNDLILSGNYTYKKFVQDFLETCSKNITHKVKGFWLYYRILSTYNYCFDRLSWKAAYFYTRKNYYLSKWYFIDLIKKIKNNNKGIKFIYAATKKIMPLL